MPDEAKPNPASTTDNKNQTPSPIDAEAIATATAKAVASEMAKANALREERVVTPTQPSAPAPQLEDPDIYDEQISAAIEANDIAKSRQLQRQQRRAIENKTRAEFSGQMSQGAAVIGRLAKQVVTNDPTYQQYAKEVDNEIAQLERNMPGVMITPDHWERALEMVAGRHRNDIRSQEREATIRKARESGVALTPEGTALGRDQHEDEQPKLEDVISPDFMKGAFRDKSREFGGRSIQEEIRVMNLKTMSGRNGKLMGDVRGIKDHVKFFLDERAEMEAVREEKPYLGLDE